MRCPSSAASDSSNSAASDAIDRGSPRGMLPQDQRVDHALECPARGKRLAEVLTSPRFAWWIDTLTDGPHKAEVVARVRPSGKGVAAISRDLDLTETANRETGACEPRSTAGRATERARPSVRS